MNGNLEPEEHVWGDQGIADQVQACITKLGYGDTELEVVIAGASIYEIDGAGTKWAPLRGTTKYNSDAFIVVRRKQEVISSSPMEDFAPEHDPYEYRYEDFDR